MKRSFGIAALAVCALIAGLTAVAWFGIDWTEEGADVYPGGLVLRDAAGEVLRVSLGEGDVDCRPYYEANPDDWIVKALVAVEDGTFWQAARRMLSGRTPQWLQNVPSSTATSAFTIQSSGFAS